MPDFCGDTGSGQHEFETLLTCQRFMAGEGGSATKFEHGPQGSSNFRQLKCHAIYL